MRFEIHNRSFPCMEATLMTKRHSVRQEKLLVGGFWCLGLCHYDIRELASATPWTSSRTSSGHSAVVAGAGLIVLTVLQEEHPLDQRNHLAGFFPHHESDTDISGDVSVSTPEWCIRARRFMMLLFVSCLSLCLYGIRLASATS